VNTSKQKRQRKTRSVAEAAQILGIGRNQAYDAIKKGELYAIRIGRRLVVPQVALDRLLSGADRAA